MSDDWKMARICPVYKNKGSTEELCNHRPISVISHVAKRAEMCVQHQSKEY